jgi:hypothetical protein
MDVKRRTRLKFIKLINCLGAEHFEEGARISNRAKGSES